MGSKKEINQISFDGSVIKYPEGYEIHCFYDDDFGGYEFHVYKNGDDIKTSMAYLSQAHNLVTKLIFGDKDE